jgi:hypothetical protein
MVEGHGLSDQLEALSRKMVVSKFDTNTFPNNKVITRNSKNYQKKSN